MCDNSQDAQLLAEHNVSQVPAWKWSSMQARHFIKSHCSQLHGLMMLGSLGKAFLLQQATP